MDSKYNKNVDLDFQHLLRRTLDIVSNILPNKREPAALRLDCVIRDESEYVINTLPVIAIRLSFHLKMK